MRMSPPSVAREELCLVVRAEAGSRDSRSLFLTPFWLTLWPWTSLSTFLGLTAPASPFHLPEISDICLLKVFQPFRRAISEKKYWFPRARDLSESSFANRGTKSLLTCVCLFVSFSLLFPSEFYLVYFHLFRAAWWILLTAHYGSSWGCSLLRSLCDLSREDQPGMQVCAQLHPNPPSLFYVLRSLVHISWYRWTNRLALLQISTTPADKDLILFDLLIWGQTQCLLYCHCLIDVQWMSKWTNE